jgi:hypothetical protein
MVSSKPPKDVLGLGQHLVRELDFEDGVDTLGRWMAHHVAELIKEAKSAPTATKRAKARKIATDTILKIWVHRESLPGNAYPLAPYRDALKVLELLRPASNPLDYFRHRPQKRRDQLGYELFDRLSRLIMALLFMKVPSRATRGSVSAAPSKALGQIERRVLNLLQQWHDIFIPASKKNSEGEKKNSGTRREKLNLDEAALGLIESITSTLVELRNEIQKSANS